MAFPWRLTLDISFILLVSGALGFMIFVDQKEVFMYINMTLISLLCIIYSFYFISVRKMDFMSWLDEKRLVGGPILMLIARHLWIFLNIRLPFWSLKKFETVIVILYLPFTTLMFAIGTTSGNATMATTCTILAIGSIIYVLGPITYLSDLKMRFKIKMNGGSLLIFSGIFLIFSDYGILVNYVGGALIIIGLCLYYDMWKEHSKGVSLFINMVAPAPPDSNDNETRTD